jgi:ATP-dependent DNA helicase RecG
VVQAIRRDAQGKKVGKLSWDDHTLSPLELLDAIWIGVPDFRESYEVPDGMFRTTIPACSRWKVRRMRSWWRLSRPKQRTSPDWRIPSSPVA